MSKDGKEIKITDKRMFTADGELREEYRFLDEKPATPEAGDPATGPGTGAPPAAGTAQPAANAAARPAAPAATPARTERAEPPATPYDLDGAADSGARLEIPGSPPGLGPSFYDLASMLAEPVAVYLGDVELPDGETAENLEMARLYIDLLDVLRQKTMGNLTAQESAFLEDLLYRLRVRYVQKRG